MEEEEGGRRKIEEEESDGAAGRGETGESARASEATGWVDGSQG